MFLSKKKKKSGARLFGVKCFGLLWNLSLIEKNLILLSGVFVKKKKKKKRSARLFGVKCLGLVGFFSQKGIWAHWTMKLVLVAEKGCDEEKGPQSCNPFWRNVFEKMCSKPLEGIPDLVFLTN